MFNVKLLTFEWIVLLYYEILSYGLEKNFFVELFIFFSILAGGPKGIMGVVLMSN